MKAACDWGEITCRNKVENFWGRAAQEWSQDLNKDTVVYFKMTCRFILSCGEISRKSNSWEINREKDKKEYMFKKSNENKQIK